MKISARLLRRLIHAAKRGYNWTELAAQGAEDYAARRDKATIERTLAAVRKATRRCPHCRGTHPVGCCAQDGHGG